MLDAALRGLLLHGVGGRRVREAVTGWRLGHGHLNGAGLHRPALVLQGGIILGLLQDVTQRHLQILLCFGRPDRDWISRLAGPEVFPGLLIDQLGLLASSSWALDS